MGKHQPFTGVTWGLCSCAERLEFKAANLYTNVRLIAKNISGAQGKEVGRGVRAKKCAPGIAKYVYSQKRGSC